MVKTYIKSVFRMFRSNGIRLFAVSIIITIGISLVTGIGGIPDKMRDAISNTVPISEQTMMADEIADKVELLGYVFPLFFIAVAALTALATITRLVEEERPIIACLKTLGYSNAAVIIKYIIFAVVCSLVGCALGIVIGNFGVLPLLYNAILARFDIEGSTQTLFIDKGLIWSAAMSGAVILTAFVVAWLKCKEKPATLLRAKPPKTGGKIALEYLPFLWRPLKFKYKSSLRNIFRYKGRMVMTVVSVIGSTMMLFCGIGMFGSLDGMREQPLHDANGFVDSIVPIAVAIIIFAVALTVLVLFNLTNINIEERRREIATLKVLGYSQNETAGFIYREILMLSVVGILVGVPLGYLLLGFVFDYVDFGSLDFVEWYIWPVTAAASFLSVILSAVLLDWKIKKIDMTSSLKTVD